MKINFLTALLIIFMLFTNPLLTKSSLSRGAENKSKGQNLSILLPIPPKDFSEKQRIPIIKQSESISIQTDSVKNTESELSNSEKLDVKTSQKMLKNNFPAIYTNDNNFNVEKWAKEVMIELVIKRIEKKYGTIIAMAGKKYEVDRDLIIAVIALESSGDPTTISSVGARGLMQLMPETAEELGVKDITDPKQNIFGGVRYLKSLIDKFGMEQALKAYMVGPNAIEYKIKKLGGPTTPKWFLVHLEKVNYIKNVYLSMI